ncbi:MAG: hypothetical protein M5R40_22485 [Anaerolineae bacterium]|nr:hypothetical protein [Anaerolineae bacterium]
MHYRPCLEAVIPRLAEGRPADWALACLSVVVGREAGGWLNGDGERLLDWALDGLPIEALPARSRA